MMIGMFLFQRIRKKIGKKQLYPLKDLDELYGNTVIYLPEDTRLSYCESLIVRCVLDLKETNNKSEIIRLKNLIASAKLEIENMKRKDL